MSSTDEESTAKESPELQKTFDTFAKVSGNDDGKLPGETAKHWLKQAGVVGEESHQIPESDADKILPKSAKENGMDMKEFEQFIEDLAKEKEMDANEIKSKLSLAVPSRNALDQKLDDVMMKLSEEE